MTGVMITAVVSKGPPPKIFLQAQSHKFLQCSQHFQMKMKNESVHA